MADVEKQITRPVESMQVDNSDENTVAAGPSGYYTGAPLHHTLTMDTQRAFPVYHRKLGNPAPLGLISFAATTLILSLYNIQTRHITVPNAVVGMAFGHSQPMGALVLLWNHTLPWSGILAAYEGDKTPQLNDALGIFLLAWFIITFIMFFGTFRSSVSLSALFFFLDLTFMLLMIGEFMQKPKVTQTGGVIGAITAFIAFYTGAAGLYSPDASYFILPVGDLPKRKDD
ncbi:glyoxylate pathway regulator [Ceratobasidium sp. AG-Ba]|nr:glyoxylate pathway regulator [Ceratobasidium sp. AG-Ba]